MASENTWINLLMGYLDKQSLSKLNDLFQNFEDNIINKKIDYTDIRKTIKDNAPDILDADLLVLEGKLNEVRSKIEDALAEAENAISSFNRTDFKDEFDKINTVSIYEKQKEYNEILENNVSYEYPIPVSHAKEKIDDIKTSRDPYFAPSANVDLFEGIYGNREFIDNSLFESFDRKNGLKRFGRVFKFFIDSNVKVFEFGLEYQQNVYALQRSYEVDQKTIRHYSGKIFISNLLSQDEFSRLEYRVIVYNADNDPIQSNDSVGPRFFFKCFKKDGYLYIFCDDVEPFRLIHFTMDFWFSKNLTRAWYIHAMVPNAGHSLKDAYGEATFGNKSGVVNLYPFFEKDNLANSEKDLIITKNDENIMSWIPGEKEMIDYFLDSKVDRFEKETTPLPAFKWPYRNSDMYVRYRQYNYYYGSFENSSSFTKDVIEYIDFLNFIDSNFKTNSNPLYFKKENVLFTKFYERNQQYVIDTIDYDLKSELRKNLLIQQKNGNKDYIQHCLDLYLANAGLDKDLNIHYNSDSDYYFDKYLANPVESIANKKLNLYYSDPTTIMVQGELAKTTTDNVCISPLKGRDLSVPNNDREHQPYFNIVQDICEPHRFTTSKAFESVLKEKAVVELEFNENTEKNRLDIKYSNSSYGYKDISLIEASSTTDMFIYDSTNKKMRLNKLGNGVIAFKVIGDIDHQGLDVTTTFKVTKNAQISCSSPLAFKLSSKADDTINNTRKLEITYETYIFEYTIGDSSIIEFDKNNRTVKGLKKGVTYLEIYAFDEDKFLDKNTIRIIIQVEDEDSSITQQELTDEEKQKIKTENQLEIINALESEKYKFQKIEQKTLYSEEKKYNKFVRLFNIEGILDDYQNYFYYKKQWVERKEDFVVKTDRTLSENGVNPFTSSEKFKSDYVHKKYFRERLPYTPSFFDMVDNRYLIGFLKKDITSNYNKKVGDWFTSSHIHETEDKLLENTLMLDNRLIDINDYPQYQSLYDHYKKIGLLNENGTPNSKENGYKLNFSIEETSKEKPLELTQTEVKYIYTLKTSNYKWDLNKNVQDYISIEKQTNTYDDSAKTLIITDKLKVTLLRRANQSTEEYDNNWYQAIKIEAIAAGEYCLVLKTNHDYHQRPVIEKKIYLKVNRQSDCIISHNFINNTFYYNKDLSENKIFLQTSQEGNYYLNTEVISSTIPGYQSFEPVILNDRKGLLLSLNSDLTTVSEDTEYEVKVKNTKKFTLDTSIKFKIKASNTSTIFEVLDSEDNTKTYDWQNEYTIPMLESGNVELLVRHNCALADIKLENDVEDVCTISWGEYDPIRSVQKLLIKTLKLGLANIKITALNKYSTNTTPEVKTLKLGIRPGTHISFNVDDNLTLSELESTTVRVNTGDKYFKYTLDVEENIKVLQKDHLLTITAVQEGVTNLTIHARAEDAIAATKTLKIIVLDLPTTKLEVAEDSITLNPNNIKKVKVITDANTFDTEVKDGNIAECIKSDDNNISIQAKALGTTEVIIRAKEDENHKINTKIINVTCVAIGTILEITDKNEIDEILVNEKLEFDILTNASTYDISKCYQYIEQEVKEESGETPEGEEGEKENTDETVVTEPEVETKKVTTIVCTQLTTYTSNLKIDKTTNSFTIQGLKKGKYKIEVSACVDNFSEKVTKEIEFCVYENKEEFSITQSEITKEIVKSDIETLTINNPKDVDYEIILPDGYENKIKYDKTTCQLKFFTSCDTTIKFRTKEYKNFFDENAKKRVTVDIKVKITDKLVKDKTEEQFVEIINKVDEFDLQLQKIKNDIKSQTEINQYNTLLETIKTELIKYNIDLEIEENQVDESNLDFNFIFENKLYKMSDQNNIKKEFIHRKNVYSLNALLRHMKDHLNTHTEFRIGDLRAVAAGYINSDYIFADEIFIDFFDEFMLNSSDIRIRTLQDFFDWFYYDLNNKERPKRHTTRNKARRNIKYHLIDFYYNADTNTNLLNKLLDDYYSFMSNNKDQHIINKYKEKITNITELEGFDRLNEKLSSSKIYIYDTLDADNDPFDSIKKSNPIKYPPHQFIYYKDPVKETDEEKVYDNTGQKLMYSDDFGETWKWTEDVLPYGIDIVDGGMKSKASGDRKVLFIIQSQNANEIWRSKDKGETWEVIPVKTYVLREEIENNTFIDIFVNEDGTQVMLLDVNDRLIQSVPNTDLREWRINTDADQYDMMNKVPITFCDFYPKRYKDFLDTTDKQKNYEFALCFLEICRNKMLEKCADANGVKCLYSYAFIPRSLIYEDGGPYHSANLPGLKEYATTHIKDIKTRAYPEFTRPIDINGQYVYDIYELNSRLMNSFAIQFMQQTNAFNANTFKAQINYSYEKIVKDAANASSSDIASVYSYRPTNKASIQDLHFQGLYTQSGRYRNLLYRNDDDCYSNITGRDYFGYDFESLFSIADTSKFSSDYTFEIIPLTDEIISDYEECKAKNQGCAFTIESPKVGLMNIDGFAYTGEKINFLSPRIPQEEFHFNISNLESSTEDITKFTNNIHEYIKDRMYASKRNVVLIEYEILLLINQVSNNPDGSNPEDALLENGNLFVALKSTKPEKWKSPKQLYTENSDKNNSGYAPSAIKFKALGRYYYNSDLGKNSFVRYGYNTTNTRFTLRNQFRNLDEVQKWWNFEYDALAVARLNTALTNTKTSQIIDDPLAFLPKIFRKDIEANKDSKIHIKVTIYPTEFNKTIYNFDKAVTRYPLSDDYYKISSDSVTINSPMIKTTYKNY